jgi:hypothetical protein
VSEPKKDPFFARRSDFLQAIAALWSKKIVKYGGKWDFLGQTTILLTSYFIFNCVTFFAVISPITPVKSALYG